MDIFTQGKTRRHFMQLTASAAAAATLPVHADAPFQPKGPVRIIVPLAAGGAADATTRALTPHLEKRWNQPVIVDNRPGGMFQIGMNLLMQAPADGHTLMYLFNSIATVQVVNKMFDLDKQVVPVTQSTLSPMIILVSGKSPYRTLGELVAYGKANPGKLNYATLGPGSIEDLKAFQFTKMAGFEANAIPYKSGPDMVRDIMGGQCDFVLTIGSFGPATVPDGRGRVLAVLDRVRMPQIPEVPTATETGIELPPLAFWGGYAVRAGTPTEIVQRLHADIARAATSSEVAARLTPLGFSAVASKAPEDFRRVINGDLSWMTEVAKSAGLI